MTDALAHIQSRTVVDEDGCWIWQGYTFRGYGQVGMECLGGRAIVHRATFFLTHGRWPAFAHHQCGKRSCCNPDHIEDMERLSHIRLHVGESCPRGHTNFRIRKGGGRYCRDCDRIRKRDHRASAHVGR